MNQLGYLFHSCIINNIFFVLFVLQLSSMGMMTEYYHFLFTTLVSRTNKLVSLGHKTKCVHKP